MNIDQKNKQHSNDAFLRPEFEPIVDLVKQNSRVLDLGCGEGHLMKILQQRRRARVQGIEISDVEIQACVSKGLFVYQDDLNDGLADFNDKSFDYVILTSTIQVLHRPDFLITEAARVGKQCIISIPNFGYWRNRFQLMFSGMMPKTKSLPYEWYNTPNIHLTTIQDFRKFCKSNKLEIVREVDLVVGTDRSKIARLNPNFFSDYAIFLLEQNSNK